MALPSRPNARLNGLPSGPRSRSQPRSASASREQSRIHSEPSSPLPPLRHQKSLTNLSEGRRGRWEQDAPPPVPSLPPPSRVSNKLGRMRGDRRDSDDSASSSSSTSSGRTARSGYSTPATEVDFEDEDKYADGEAEEGEEQPVPRGFGYSLWSRIQTAATNLSVNVGKSWEANGALGSGEGVYSISM